LDSKPFGRHRVEIPANRVEHPDMSAVAEHSINTPLHNTTALHIKPINMDYLIRQARETEFHPNDTNRYKGVVIGISYLLPEWS
jgi:hypothetical protein